jgi:hypothetical protein
MRHVMLIVSALSAFSCATGPRGPVSYKGAIDVQYMGNNKYLVSSAGTSYNTGHEIRAFFFRAAFDACKPSGKGFEVGQLNGGAEKTVTGVTGAASKDGTFYANEHSVSKPYMSGVIECRGEVDSQLAAQVQAQVEADAVRSREPTPESKAERTRRVLSGDYSK